MSSGFRAQPAQSTGENHKVLVGVNYFAGWWPELPNKYHGRGWSTNEPDWRPDNPQRCPMLGDYNDQPTMNREIAAASAAGVDFFSILYYYAPAESPLAPTVAKLNRGLGTFLLSSNASRMHFMVEYCNSGKFGATNEVQWEECLKVWLLAFHHPSYLRVGGRLVFKIHNGSEFYAQAGGSLERARARLERLRQSVRNAGLPDLLIGAGIMSRSKVSPESPVAKLFDFTATYMSIPPVEVRESEYPFSLLNEEAQQARAWHAKDPIPWVPYVAAGWNPRPWTHTQADPNHRRFFTFPTAQEWTEALRSVRDDFAKYPSLGLPLPGGGRQKVFTIYAWNEFGEGGFVAPTKGEGYLKLNGIKEVFLPH